MGQLLAELRGAAEAAEVPLQVLCSLSLQYEARWAWQICTAFSLSDRSVRTLKEHHANEVLRIIPP